MRRVRSIALIGLVSAVGLWPGTGAHASAAGMKAHVRIVENASTGKYRYKPATISIEVGDDVTWNNASDAPHTVTFAKGYDKTVQPGGHVQRTFKKAGTFKYMCTIHTYMHGKVVVS